MREHSTLRIYRLIRYHHPIFVYRRSFISNILVLVRHDFDKCSNTYNDQRKFLENSKLSSSWEAMNEKPINGNVLKAHLINNFDFLHDIPRCYEVVILCNNLYLVETEASDDDFPSSAS